MKLAQPPALRRRAVSIAVALVTVAAALQIVEATSVRASHGLWTRTGTPLRMPETLTLLADGRVLALAEGTAEVYDPDEERLDRSGTEGGEPTNASTPRKGAWTAVQPPEVPRSRHTATLLDGPNCQGTSPGSHCGKVLMLGGRVSTEPSLVAELFDPTSGRWTPAAPAPSARYGHTATLLDGASCKGSAPPAWCGKVLVAGGVTYRIPPDRTKRFDVATTPEIYDPQSNTWTTVDATTRRRHGHSAIALHDGRVLLLGGSSLIEAYTDEAHGVSPPQIYDPGTATLSDLPQGGERGTPTLLDDPECVASGTRCARVLVTGMDNGDSLKPWAKLLELSPEGVATWSTAASPKKRRPQHAASSLPGGRILVLGGKSGALVEGADIYSPPTSDAPEGTWVELDESPLPRATPAAIRLATDQVLVLGVGPVTVGKVGNATLSPDALTAEVFNTSAYDPSFKVPAADLSVALSAPASAAVDDELLYTATVKNLSPDVETYAAAPATDTRLTVVLDRNVSYRGSDHTGCEYRDVGNPPRTVTCALGDLASADEVTVTIRTTVTTALGSTIRTSASVATATADPNNTNNAAAADTSFDNRGGTTDLAVTICQPSLTEPCPTATAPVHEGDELTLGVVVDNQGAEAATGVTAKVVLPRGAEYRSATSTQGTCIKEEATLRCPLGGLDPGQKATVTVILRPETRGYLVTLAAVEAATRDDNLANNVARNEILVQERPNSNPVSVRIAAHTATADPAATVVVDGADVPAASNGGKVVFNVTVKNDGKVPLGDVLLHSFGAGNFGKYNRFSATQGDCSRREDTTASGNVDGYHSGRDYVTCALGVLDAGAEARVEVEGTVLTRSEEQDAVITHIALVQTRAPGDRAGDNRATLTMPIVKPGRPLPPAVINGLPFIEALEPAGGPPRGGTTVRIVGHNFDHQAEKVAVWFGPHRAEVVTASSANELIVTSPPSPAGVGRVPVVVTTPGGTTGVVSPVDFGYTNSTWSDQAPLDSCSTPESAACGARAHHTATRLPNGAVLVLGGTVNGSPGALGGLLFTPQANTWKEMAPITVRRYEHTATLLDGPECRGNATSRPSHCGKILVVGGFQASDQPLATAELYDPANGGSSQLTRTPLRHARAAHTATLLEDGRVLVAGGTNKESGRVPVGSAEIYDPATDTWTPAGDMADARGNHSATLLGGPECGQADAPKWCGKVLVAGGVGSEPIPKCVNVNDKPSCTKVEPLKDTDTPDETPFGDRVALRSAELFDPATRTWAATGELDVARYGHTATLLSGETCGGMCGRVLVTGGSFTALQYGQSTEVYDPKKAEWQAGAPLNTPRSGHTATVLPTGGVLVAGRSRVHVGNPDDHGTAFNEDNPARTASAEVYDPRTDRWTPVASMATARGAHTATLLDGPDCGTQPGRALPPWCFSVLVVGGWGPANAASSWDADPITETVERFNLGLTMTAIKPGVGPSIGGTPVTITGFGFTDATEVVVDDAPATGVTVHSYERVTATSPAHRSGSFQVVVRTGETSSKAIDPAPETTFAYVVSQSPGAVTDLRAKAASEQKVELTFNAAGTDGPFPPLATHYVVKQSRSPISAENFDDATSLCEGGVCTVPEAKRQTVEVGGLLARTKHFFAIAAVRDDGERGPVALFAPVTTLGDHAPGRVRGLDATALSAADVRLSFMAAGSHGGFDPPATTYVIKQSDKPIANDGAFDAAREVCVCEFGPARVGDALSVEVHDLEPATTYHYAIKAKNADGVMGPLSDSAQVRTLGESSSTCAASQPAGPGQLSYGSGYSLVGLPASTSLPVRRLYGWADMGAGGAYSVSDPSTGAAGLGYWAYFGCPATVSVTAGAASARLSLGAYHATIVGNPSASAPATVGGADFVATWDATANGGAGGYRVSGYRERTDLPIGAGAWAFSYQDTTLVVDAPSP